MDEPLPDFGHMNFREYWQTYLPDLIEPLPDADRDSITNTLASGFLDGDLPGRELVQRLIESHMAIITTEQYASWSLSNASDDGTAHVLSSLANGFCVGGSREKMLEYLAHVEYSDGFAERVRTACTSGLLTADEVERILTTSLRNAPLPPISERPADVPALPFARSYSTRTPYETF